MTGESAAESVEENVVALPRRLDPGEPSRAEADLHKHLNAAVRTAATGDLPPDVLEPAMRRLQAILLVGAALSAVALGRLAFTEGPPVAGALPLVASLLISSLLIGGLVHLPRLSLTAKRDLGNLYLLGVCFALNLLRHLDAAPAMVAETGISPAVLPMLSFAALIPSSRKTSLLLAVACAALDPLTLGIVVSQSEQSFAPAMLWPLWPTFAAAGIAAAISRAAHSLNERVEKARQIGSYELVAKLGSGAMAEVWRAKHRMLARPAAVKLIRPQVLLGHGPEGAERLVRLFMREARATSELSSPHTIQLYDFGVAREGAFYYVMELLDGVDLQHLVERFGPLPEERACHFLEQAAESLSEAHSKNFVHRDVKPANLFSCRLGGRVDFVKVLDFGLVLDRHPTVEELDDERRFAGTPSIMAPEMVRFQAPVDARADVYALGCVGYWLLTGHRVFEADTRQDMLVMHAHQKPVTPSKRVGRTLHPGLEALIMQCLEKNPGKRPQSCRELGDDLHALVFEHPWTRERADAWWRTYSPTDPRPAEK